MSEWKECYLSDVGTLARGKSKHRPRWAEHLYGRSYPFIQTGEISAANKYINTYQQMYSEAGLAQSKLWDKGTLCITIAANIAEIAILDFPACFPDSVLGFIPDPEKADLDFVFYTLTFLKERIQNLAIGSVQENINLGTFQNIKFLFPLIDEQKQIAAVLSCLDRKIENLRKQNETLEAIAQTLFKHWFVDFEFPNEDGKHYKSSGGAMVRSELGKIPVGWHVGKLGDIGKNIRDGISEDEIQPEMSYIALDHMPRKQIALDSWGTAADIASNKFIFEKGNILFGKLRPYFHKVGVAFISGICSTDILVLDSKRKELFSFLLMILSSDELIKYVSLASEGTRMPRTSWGYIKEYPICIPDNSVVSVFNNLVKALINKIENNIFQIQTLTKTRDVLLPQLMSGKLRITE